MAEAEEATIAIEAIGHRGDGIGHHDGLRVFVPGTTAGDIVRVALSAPRAGRRRGRLLEILRPSPDRASPPCPHFGPCGGCAVQQLKPEAYRRWKLALIETALAQHDIDPAPLAALVSTPPASRRRAVLSARRSPRGTVLGFHQRAGRRIADIHSCLVLTPTLEALLAPLRATLAEALAMGQTAAVTLIDSDSGTDIALAADTAPGLAAREALAALAGNPSVARIAWRHQDEIEPVAIKGPVLTRFGDHTVALPPGAFLQATREGEAAIVQAVGDGLGDAETIADLYAGCGTLCLSIPSLKSAFAVEMAEAPLAALSRAAEAGGKIDIETDRRNLARHPLDAARLESFDAVVVDPPRAGAERQCREIARSRVGRVVMVSCAPRSFARDAAILLGGGFQLTRLTPIDQFLWSAHMELVAAFTRNP